MSDVDFHYVWCGWVCLAGGREEAVDEWHGWVW